MGHHESRNYSVQRVGQTSIIMTKAPAQEPRERQPVHWGALELMSGKIKVFFCPSLGRNKHKQANWTNQLAWKWGQWKWATENSGELYRNP